MTNVSPATIASAITSSQTTPVTSTATTTGTTTTGTAATTATTTATGSAGTSSTGKAALNSDFETFLKMLTVQAQNQDPLNPMDSTEYAAQLAAFSSVEQQVLTNDLLTGLDGRFGSMGLAQMAHWVGMEARVAAPANFTGKAVEILPTVEALADSAKLVVTNKDGTEVQRVAIDPKAETVSWSGLGSDGKIQSNGLYSFAVESFAAGKLLKSNPAQIYAKISEIQNQDGAISLVLEGGTKISTSKVTALRED